MFFCLTVILSVPSVFGDLNDIMTEVNLLITAPNNHILLVLLLLAKRPICNPFVT